ncbi:MAG: hypothetical protein IJ865_08865, partial [Clostridia bacterium]|nr:hypothetical protein [Clostridia bacterium]
MATSSYKCPDCGANCSANDEGVCTCEHCGASFTAPETQRVVNVVKNYHRMKAQDVEMYRAETARKEALAEKRTGIVVLLVLFLMIIIGFESSGRSAEQVVHLNTPESDFRNQDYQIVESQLRDAGFKTVVTDPIVDASSTIFGSNYHKVEHVYINGVTNFKKKDTFHKNDTVRITYHADGHEGKYKLPFGVGELRNKPYQDVITKLENAGLTNVTVTPFYDATNKRFGGNVGKVIDVWIDGNNSFKKGEYIEYDPEVL